MGVRKICALVHGLPPGCAVHRELDPKGWHWTQETEILAATFEALDLSNAMYQASNSKEGGGKIRKLVKVPRPSDEETEVTTDPETIEAFFGAGGSIEKR